MPAILVKLYMQSAELPRYPDCNRDMLLSNYTEAICMHIKFFIYIYIYMQIIIIMATYVQCT